MASARKIALPLMFFAAGCAPALAGGYGAESSFPFVDNLVQWARLDNLDGDHRDFLGLILVGYSLAFGYFAHLFLRGASFGIAVNAIIAVIGCSLALIGLGPRFGLLSRLSGKTQEFVMTIGVAAAAVPMLLLAVTLALALRRGSVNLFYFRMRRRQDAQRAHLVQAELPPRIADIVKKSA